MIGQLGNLGQLGLSGGSRQLTPRMVPGCMWEYDLYNWSTLFQDKNGTIPVTAYGQPIGLNLDLSQGLTVEGRCAIHDGTTTNYFSTPDSVASSVTGDITILWSGKLASVEPSAFNVLIDKWGPVGLQSYVFYQSLTNGLLGFAYSLDGINIYSPASTVNLASVGITANTRVWLYVQRVASTGLIKFFYSLDGITYTQLGADVSGTAGNLFDSTFAVGVGIRVAGTLYPLTGKTYQAKIFAGIGITGTPVVDFNPSLYTSGSTFTASTGEVWTINGNAAIVNDYRGNHRFSESAARPTLKLSASGKPCLYYPGTGRYMQTNPFALGNNEFTLIHGVRKLAETGVIVNFSPSVTSNNGSFAIKNISGGYAAKSKGTVESESSVTGYGLPVTSLIGVRSKISTDINELWVDGVLKNTATIDQGTGNFGTFGLYFGSNGTSEFSTMHEFSSCGFNRFLTDAQFAAMNRYINNKTGAY